MIFSVVLASVQQSDSVISKHISDFLGGSDSKESACNAENLGSIPGLTRCPGGEHDNPLQFSCLEKPMDRRTYGL